MGSTREKRTRLLGRSSVPVMLLCGAVFVASILLLFSHEKRRLDAEYDGMIADSLNIHTSRDAAEIDRIIEEASRSVQTVAAMLKGTDGGTLRDILARRNEAAPIYAIEYVSAEEMAAGALSPLVRSGADELLRRLARGEIAVGDVSYDGVLAGYFITVIVPMRENGVAAGALYTRVSAENLLPHNAGSAVYQDAVSSLITGDGSIIFNTFSRERVGNFYQQLENNSLTEEDISYISGIIASPEVESATFERRGETYFVSAAPLRHNGWHLVTFVRGPDVLLRSATVFRDMVRIGSLAILITAGAACVILLQLLLSKRRLEEERQRSQSLARRLGAMFDQHSALMVTIDTETRRIVDVNAATCAYFGAERQEFLGQPVQKFNPLPTHVLDEQLRTMSNGKATFFAAPHRLKNGEIKFLDVYATVIDDGVRRLFYAILFDSTDREQYRDELFREKELLRTTLQSIGDGVVTTDNQGRITSLNSVAEALTGWESALAIGKSFNEVFVLQNEEAGHIVESPVQKVLDTGVVVGLANHTELVNRQRGRVPIADSAAPIKAEDGQTFGVVMVFRDVSREKEHSRQVEFLSYHDVLTGLYNRRYLEETMARLEGEGKVPVSVVMADVNGLKITNDVFGHKAGDALLKSVAHLMRTCCREDAVIARWGGDEFVILLPGTGIEVAEAIVSEMKDTHMEIEDIGLSLSLSLGCACRDRAEQSIQSAMQQAEKHMYQQKLLDGKSYRNAIISTLLATLYEKSNETEEHSKRLEDHCHAIGRRLRLSSKEMDELSLLALLHDIGKVSINPGILQKPDKLTDEEWEEMRRHPEVGYRIAQETPELAVVADLILSHHERWDGGGYPRGLKEGEIPLACRILAVVDAFDAMTNDRVYRRAMTVTEAIVEIKKNQGRQFEPRVAALFIEIVTGEKVDWQPQKRT